MTDSPSIVPTFEDDDFPSDVIPLDVESPESGDGSACIVCGTALTYSGRGRRPKYCADHKPSRASSSTPRSASKGKGSQAIRADIQNTLLGVGAMLASIDQYDAAVVISSAPKLADVLGSMAEQYPEFRKFLEGGNKSVVWLQLGIAVSALTVPILAHHGMIPMDEREAFIRFHGDPVRAAQQAAAS